MEIFYISDLHLFHENILSFCNRPYKNLDEMHGDIIRKWNSVVSKNDVVRIAGDVGFPKNKEDIKSISNIIRKLNGNKSLIVGNHDHKLLKDEYFIKSFSNIDNYMRTVDKGRLMIISHYPMEEWDGCYKGSYHGFGHVHDKDSHLKKIENRFNLSFDALGGIPRTLDWLIELNKKNNEYSYVNK